MWGEGALPLCASLVCSRNPPSACGAPWGSADVASGGMHSSGMMAAYQPVLTVGSGFGLSSLAWNMGFQCTGLLAAFTSSTSALSCWVLHPTT